MTESLTDRQIKDLVEKVNKRITRMQGEWSGYVNSGAGLETLDGIQEEISHMVTFRQGLLVAVGEGRSTIEFISALPFKERRKIEFDTRTGLESFNPSEERGS